MTDLSNLETVADGAFLRLVRRGKWEFAQRKNSTGVVIVVALTNERKVIFVEQFRPPVNARVVEFPAGLAGDIEGAEDESLEEAAARELAEETGYTAGRLRRAFQGPTSAGMTDETCMIFLADDLQQEGEGGGDASESIQVHEIPLDEVDPWLESKVKQGCAVGVRVYSGLYFLRKSLHGVRAQW